MARCTSAERLMLRRSPQKKMAVAKIVEHRPVVTRMPAAQPAIQGHRSRVLDGDHRLVGKGIDDCRGRMANLQAWRGEGALPMKTAARDYALGTLKSAARRRQQKKGFRCATYAPLARYRVACRI